MIAWDIWALFFGYTIPMVISPGPGNTLLAAVGGRYRVSGSLPFWIGFELANVVLCTVYGLGLGQAVHGHPAVEAAIKWAGTAYVLYLAWSFFSASARPASPQGEAVRRLGWRDGFVSVMLNPKIHSMILVMFSQFLAPALPLVPQVAAFTLAFLAVGLACHFVWIYGGQVVLSRFRSQRAVRIQGIVFGICMLLVAAYLGFA